MLIHSSAVTKSSYLTESRLLAGSIMKRTLQFEALERRKVFAGDLPYATGVISLDVNNDDWVTPIDALLIINELNTTGSGVFNPFRPGEHVGWWDTNGDGRVSPIDALVVINHLNTYGAGPAPHVVDHNFAPVGQDMNVVLPSGISNFVFRPAIIDPENADLAYAVSTQPLHGSVTAIGNGLFSYQADQNFSGADLLEILATDIAGLTGRSTVRLTVSSGTSNGAAPQATDDMLDVEKNVQITFNATYNDVSSTPVEIVSFTQPLHGLLEQDPSGSLIYTPNRDYVGEDACTYTIRNNSGLTSVGRITFRIA